MDLSSFTTDDLLATIPADEDDKWELKKAAILQNKGELKKELGKQVSAFSNSGGGYLVFGIDEKARQQPESCEQFVGRQSMKDFLSTLTEQSVENPIRDFRVHRIPFTGDGSDSVFVIEIGDSPAAPHQAKDERQYYYRIDGHSKPAPHFHLELLRNRITKAILSVTNCDYELIGVVKNKRQVLIELVVEVKNDSLHCATHWGVHVRCEDDYWSFQHGKKQLAKLSRGAMTTSEPPVLLPSQTGHARIRLLGKADATDIECDLLWSRLRLILHPISQNCKGNVHVYEWSDEEQRAKALCRFNNEFEKLGVMGKVITKEW